MQTMNRLMDDHDAMDALADALLQFARPGRASGAQCHALLNRFQQALAAHLAAEARLLNAATASDRPDPFETALIALREDFAALADGWAHYLGHWTEHAITADRAAFSQETGDMMTAFKLRIARETSIVYPLALATGRICLYED